MIYCLGDISVWSRRILLNFCWVSIFSDILIANISWTVALTSLNYTIFWKGVMRTFRSIYVNYLTDFGFLLRSGQNCRKYTFFGNLWTITQEKNMEKLDKWSHFCICFFRSNCLQHSFLYLKTAKIYFHVVPLWSILVCKIPQFWEKATDSDNPSYFSRN